MLVGRGGCGRGGVGLAWSGGADPREVSGQRTFKEREQQG